MAVRHQQVETAIQVRIEEEATKAQRQPRGLPHRGPRRLINKKPVPLVPVKAHHLI